MDHSALQSELQAILSSDTFAIPEAYLAPAHDGPNVRFLDDGSILALPRRTGDSRYVYGDNGFNAWVHTSGYIYANEGLFSLFTRKKEGEEPVIAFFLGVADKRRPGEFERYSLLPVPVIDETERNVVRRFVIMNREAAYFVTELSVALAVVRVTVDDRNRMAFSLYVRNTGRSKRSLWISSYFRPFCRHQIFESDEDRWFGETASEPRVEANGAFAAATLHVHEDIDRFQSATYYALLRGRFSASAGVTLDNRQTNTSRLNYVGDSRRNLASASVLRTGQFEKTRWTTVFNDLAVISDINRIVMKGNSRARIDYTLELVPNEAEQQRLAAVPIDPQEIDRIMVASRQRNQRNLSRLTVNVAAVDSALPFQASDLNQFFEHLKHQVSICGLLKGYMQLAPRSLIGIRDVFQALEGLQLYRPEESRRKMLEALGFTTLSGRCLRQYSLPRGGAKAGTADVRPFIDQGVWIITAIHSYLQNTGDSAFLEEEVGYHAIIDEASHAVEPVPERDSVLRHLFRIMEYLNNNRDHEQTKLLLALYGDWNDALDGLGISLDPGKKYGTGVSVMATLQYYQNCQEMIDILETFYPGRYEEQVKQYQATRQSLEQNLPIHAVVQDAGGNRRIVHGWGDRRSYLVGSYHDPDGQPRDGLTSNAFWVISGLLQKTPDLESTILDAFQRLDGKYGLMTFTPAFPRGATGVGRIPKLPPGTAENGATYIHATLFGIMAYFMMGRPREAWLQIAKILPFTPLHGNYSHSPFVMPNSYVHNPEKGLDGESMNDWQTGSSNVLLKILLWHVFGYKPDFRGLNIQLASWTPFQQFNLKTEYRGKTIDLRYTKEKSTSKRQFIVNGGTSVAGVYSTAIRAHVLFIPIDNLGTTNVIQIVDPSS